MTSIVELFPKCRKLAYDARQQLSQVQNGILYPSELFLSLDELNNQLDIMDDLTARETPQQRQVWKRKILELREDCTQLRQYGEQYDSMMNSNIRHLREREELLRRRGGGGGGSRQQQSSTTTVDENDLNNLADERDSLQSSTNMVNDIIMTGEASLSGLQDQRRSLRGINKTLLDMSNRLGLTNATMRIIERRDITDAYLVAAGMVITLLVLYFVWFF